MESTRIREQAEYLAELARQAELAESQAHLAVDGFFLFG